MKDQLTVKRIDQIHPMLCDELHRDYNEISAKLGDRIAVRFTQVFRTKKEQQDLYNQGRTTPGKKVTNALPGQSFHEYGLAFDIALLYDKNGDGNFEEVSWDIKRDQDRDGKSDWMTVVNFFKSKGWKWGGDFKSFKDYPHFEKTFGFTWKQLARLNKDQFGYVIF